MSAFRSKTITVADPGTPIATLSEPAGAASGDILFMWVLAEAEGLGTGVAVFTDPTGWTRISTQINDGVSGSSRFSAALWYIVRGGAAPSYVLPYVISGGTGTYFAGSVSCWNGQDPTSPINAAVLGSMAMANPSNPDAPSATSSVANCLAIAFGASWGGNAAAGSYSPPSGYTIVEDGSTLGGQQTLCVAYKLVPAATSEDPGAFSGAISGNDPCCGATVMLATDPSAAPQNAIYYVGA